MATIVFDDTPAVPAEIGAFAGIDRFGSIVYRRKSLRQAIDELAEKAGWTRAIHLRTASDLAALAEDLRNQDDTELYLICPSNIVSSGNFESRLTFLQQVAHSPMPLYMFIEDSRGRRGWALMRASMLRQYLRKQIEGDLDGFFEEMGERFVHVHDRLPLLDLREEAVLQEFLSGQFDARHFNAVERDQYTVVKRSRDPRKLRQEFDFYRLVPPIVQTFLVQPFDFQINGSFASYRMERIGVPDLATQWVNGAIQEHEFERFLGHIFYFLSIRPKRDVTKRDCETAQQSLYREKVRSRTELLKAHHGYVHLEPLLERVCGGIDSLVNQYFHLLDSHSRASHCNQLVIGHGDLCFSNIFYSKTSQYLKFIDPRGAESEEGLYTDPYYDVAKLSHSIQGNYDFVNNDKFDVVIDDDLKPVLQIEAEPPPWAKKLFENYVGRHGFDQTTVRLYEASLFISMLPLHMDRPRKVLGFAVAATNILSLIANRKSAT